MDIEGPNLNSNEIFGGTLVTKPTSPKQVAAKWRHLPRSLKRGDSLVEIDNGKRKVDVITYVRMDVPGGGQVSKKKKSNEEVCDGVTVVSGAELELFSSSSLRSTTIDRYPDQAQ